MRRREFIAGLGGAAAAPALWPLAARAQQPAIPVVGFLHLFSPEAGATALVAFREGLGESGYVDGRNVTIEVRWAENHIDMLPALAADLVRRRVAVIYAGSPPATRAAKAATAEIPIVFAMGEDPVREGLVANLNQPGGNITGFSDFSNQLAGKRLGLLHDTVPRAGAFAVLVNPTNPNAEPDAKDAKAAANVHGLELRVLTARTERDFETAFAALIEFPIGGLLVNIDSLFLERREQLAALALRLAIPTICDRREFAAAGHLMSYGPERLETSRRAGVYVGRILSGEKPGDLPVQQPTKFQFVINLKTAKTLGLEIPPRVLAIADEVIE